MNDQVNHIVLKLDQDAGAVLAALVYAAVSATENPRLTNEVCLQVYHCLTQSGKLFMDTMTLAEQMNMTPLIHMMDQVRVANGIA